MDNDYVQKKTEGRTHRQGQIKSLKFIINKMQVQTTYQTSLSCKYPGGIYLQSYCGNKQGVPEGNQLIRHGDHKPSHIVNLGVEAV